MIDKTCQKNYYFQKLIHCMGNCAPPLSGMIRGADRTSGEFLSPTLQARESKREKDAEVFRPRAAGG
jgi:hypothetical protein